MNKRIILFVLLSMFTVLACEKENPDNSVNNSKTRLSKVLVKDWGYIEFIYEGNRVEEMICAFTNLAVEYAVFDFVYENECLSEVIRNIHPDSINSIPRATTLYTIDFIDDQVVFTADWDTSTLETNEKEIWNLDSEGNLIQEKRNYTYVEHNWEGNKLYQSQKIIPGGQDSIRRIDTYQYENTQSPFSLFSKEFLITMRWIVYDFFFDYFEGASLSINNCTTIEFKNISSDTIVSYKYFSYEYNEESFPQSIQINDIFFELEYN